MKIKYYTIFILILCFLNIYSQAELSIPSQDIVPSNVLPGTQEIPDTNTSKSLSSPIYSWLKTHLKESWLEQVKSGALPTPIHYFLVGCLPEYAAYKKLSTLMLSKEKFIEYLKRDGLTTGKEFVHTNALDSVLTKIGLNAQNIVVLEATEATNELYGACAAGSSVIIIDSSYLAERKSFNEGDVGLFILGHEATHLKQNCILKLALVSLLSPFVAHYGLTWYDKAVKKGIDVLVAKAQLEKDSFGYSFLEKTKKVHSYIATSWLAKAIVAFNLSCLIARYYEKDADMTSALALGQSATLGGILFFSALRDSYLNALKNNPKARFLFNMTRKPHGFLSLGMNGHPVCERSKR